MNERSADNLNKFFDLNDHEGEDKVTSLKDAIAENIRPGMNLYISPEGGAAVCELLRQFHQTKPDFDLTVVGATEHILNLVHCGLIKKLITTNCSHIYPSPGLSSVIQKAYKEKGIEIENWTLYSHLQRLMAGALGVGFLPTQSVIGSSMEEENHDSFVTMDDPFGVKGRVGLVKALNPDVSIVHGWAADRYGNTIGAPISSQIATDHNMWGAKASKNGVIVTVEKIVSTDFIRKYASLVALPGYMVKSVCQVAFGAHPQGMMSPVPHLFKSYAPDYDFVSDHRANARKDDAMENWIREWILDTRNHEGYMEKIGNKRLNLLQEKADGNYWKKNNQVVVDATSADEPPSDIETMIIMGNREIVESVLENNFKVLLGGIGSGMLATYCAYYQLKEKNYDVELVVGTGSFGFAPRPGDPFYGTYNNLHSCKALFDTADIYGCLIAGEKSKSMSVLGAAEVDRYGNINTTKMRGTFLIGSGGANDAANASEVLVLAKQTKQRFVDRVSYVTCPGRNVKKLVSDMGIFQKLDGDEDFTLVACLPGSDGTGLDEKVRKVRENCGWDLKIADRIVELPMPREKELFLIRSFDPERSILNG